MWLPLWEDLQVKQGWRSEKGPSGVNYYLPPGVFRSDPSFRTRRDFFDSKTQVRGRA